MRSRYGCAPSSSKIAAARARSGTDSPASAFQRRIRATSKGRCSRSSSSIASSVLGEGLGRRLDRHAGGRRQSRELVDRRAEQPPGGRQPGRGRPGEPRQARGFGQTPPRCPTPSRRRRRMTDRAPRSSRACRSPRTGTRRSSSARSLVPAQLDSPIDARHRGGVLTEARLGGRQRGQRRQHRLDVAHARSDVSTASDCDPHWPLRTDPSTRGGGRGGCGPRCRGTPPRHRGRCRRSRAPPPPIGR